MMIEYIPLIVALIGTAISAYDDWKTSYLNDKLIYGMIGFGLIWNVIFSTDFISVFLTALIIFLIGFVSYLFGQIGGGDVFLFTALALLIPVYPAYILPLISLIGITPATGSILPFVISIFFLAGLTGPMFYYPLTYFFKILKIKKKIKNFKQKIIKSTIYFALTSIAIIIFMKLSIALSLVLFPLAIALLIVPFKNDILKYFCLEKKLISKLTDDDVLALEFIDEKIIKKLGLSRKTLLLGEIKKVQAKAKKFKIKDILVCENLPKFVPFIFLSLLINLLVGDILLYVLVTF